MSHSHVVPRAWGPPISNDGGTKSVFENKFDKTAVPKKLYLSCDGDSDLKFISLSCATRTEF